jgi:nicotinate-nucleotide adenylyltransferase
MKIGLYFGSFNPVHIGHLIIASHIADNTDLQQVWFVVSPQNPFKSSSVLLNEYDRLHLIQLSIEGDVRLKASDVEFKLPRPSYTIDTLIYLKEKYPQHEFVLILGSDSFQNLPRWKNAEILIKNYSFIVYERPDFTIDEFHGANVTLLKAPLLQVSATTIRQVIAEGKSIRYLVPEKAREEIERSNYYK